MYLTKKKTAPTSIIFMNVLSHYELLTCGQPNNQHAHALTEFDQELQFILLLVMRSLLCLGSLEGLLIIDIGWMKFEDGLSTVGLV